MDIKEKINNFPKTPGIYLMKDKENNIIYVGKSKKLQERIKSYFVDSSSHSRKVQRMVKGIADIEIITTDTELDALLLECEMIKKIRPMYNKLMKNHENYNYIKIDKDIKYPHLQVVQEIEDNQIHFGPYSSGRKLEEIKSIIDRSFSIRSCKKMSKCFNYDLGRCIGPCREHVTEKQYKDIIEKVITDLSGDTNYIFDILQGKMQEEIIKLNFENANDIKQDIDKIKSLFNKQEVINDSSKEEILAWIKLNNSEYKVYTISKGSLVKSEIMNIDEFYNIDKKEYFKSIIEQYANKSTYELNTQSIENKKIDKSAIDFVNIIYSYIRYNKDIEYILI